MTAAPTASEPRLDGAARHHLERLMASWGILADFSFSDLLLYVPADGGRFVIFGQMRPATSQTLFPSDRVGEVAAQEPLVERAWQSGVITSGDVPGGREVGPLRREAIPVRHDGQLVGVLVRVWSPRVGRRVGGLERVYRWIFERLAAMVASGLFPYKATVTVLEDAPRVGDGVLVLDAGERISFASPNAVSALHRLGATSSIVGATLTELGVTTGVVAEAFSSRHPAHEEFARPPDLRVIFHCIPLIERQSVVGAAVMLRDVTDLRRRDRLLDSKDATMREIHHRVKNNLQTISSLLRLQSRRVGGGPAQTALEEAERRIRSIAVVHDALSREPIQRIAFSEIVPALVELARVSGRGSEAVEVAVSGEAGDLPAEVATPLALLVAELLQNAAEHGRRGGKEPLAVELSFSIGERGLVVVVRDDGRGFPKGFDLETKAGLGLSIVRDLVRTQLLGTIEVRNDNGAVVEIVVPHPGGGEVRSG